jgi:hypothetical protein
MTRATWRFRAMTRDEVNIDPFEDEFFTTEMLQGIHGALVREAIQNFIDTATGRRSTKGGAG